MPDDALELDWVTMLATLDGDWDDVALRRAGALWLLPPAAAGGSELCAAGDPPGISTVFPA